MSSHRHTPHWIAALGLLITIGFYTQAASAGLATYDSGRTKYLVYTPKSYTADKELPAVFAFHWSTGRAQSMLKLWRETAERYGFILVIPNARHRMRWTKRDAADVQGILGSVIEKYSVDISRLYATGFSSGANFTYRVLVENPGVFRAVGPFGGRLVHRTQAFGSFTSTADTRICVFHGTRDKTIDHKHARRARTRLRAHGFEVVERDFRQGHWLPREYADDMWQCLDGIHHDGES
ncbi:MAG: PHB depolymerase family esterase [Myxococcota bacterium]|nr:PHB depolymerase family esterase [Myxococcota bacterium]